MEAGMKRFRNILVVLAGGGAEAPLIARAIELARQNGARLTFVGVVETPASMLPALLGGQADAQAAGEQASRLEPHIAAQVAGASEAGVSASGQILRGVPYEEVIRTAVAGGHDLVMTQAAQGSVGGRAQPLGATDLQLLRKCPVPVWVLKPSRRAVKPRVLALVDPDPQDADRNRLNVTILELGWSLAQMQGGELHVGHAWRLMAEDTLRSSSFLQMRPEEVDAMLNEERRQRRRLVEQLVAAHVPAAVKASIHLAKGDPAAALAMLAARHRPDVIVMGTVGRSGLSGLILGNTAESLLPEVTCSVLAVKPAEFRTPVTVA
jgi:nucleotide-binding universal stress UspA family protein